MIAYLIVLLVPLCECDNRGTQINVRGEWCNLNERPCKLLTGVVVDWPDVQCVWNNNQQVECPAVGNDSSSSILIPAF